MNILMAEDDEWSRLEITDFLTKAGHRVVGTADGNEAWHTIKTEEFDMVLSDNVMPKMSGIDLLRNIKKLPHGQDVDVVILTAFGNMDNAIEAFRAGAYDYLLKPINIEELVLATERVAEHQASKKATQSGSHNYQEALSAGCHYIGRDKIIAQSQDIKACLDFAERLYSDRSVPVLIEGETGTGKEVLARLIHCGQGDFRAPFIAINCAALPPTVFESELFGYEAGAFTGGLAKGKKGKIDMAAGGTLFLDEIGELPMELQAKLLRVIDEREFYRVGGLKVVKADIRVISATNQVIEKAVTQGTFRRDLYYRLNVGRIHLPPLRQRTEDIIPLAQLFLDKFSHNASRGPRIISSEAAAILLAYQWPGNVREIKNAMQKVTLQGDETVLLAGHLKFLNHYRHLPSPGNLPLVIEHDNVVDLPADSLPIEELYNSIVLKALERHEGNKTRTAQYLGISRSSLLYRLKQLGL